MTDPKVFTGPEAESPAPETIDVYTIDVHRPDGSVTRTVRPVLDYGAGERAEAEACERQTRHKLARNEGKACPPDCFWCFEARREAAAPCLICGEHPRTALR